MAQSAPLPVPSTKWRKIIAENFNRLSRVHERYRQTTDRRTDDDIRSRSLKIEGCRPGVVYFVRKKCDFTKI